MSVQPGATDSYRGSAACLIANEGQLLLVERRFCAGVGLPGGRSKPDESAQCTAHREVWEETGVHVAVGPLLERSGNTSVYRCALMQDVPVAAQPNGPWRGRFETASSQWMEFGRLGSLKWRFSGQGELVQNSLEAAPDR